MIPLSRLRQQTTFLLNPDLFQRIESHVDTTVIHMNDGAEYVVSDTAEDIVERIIEYRARIIAVAGLFQQRGFGGDQRPDGAAYDAGDVSAPVAALTSPRTEDSRTEEPRTEDSRTEETQ